MKKKVIIGVALSTVCLIASFLAGYNTCYNVNEVDILKSNQDLCHELIEINENALNKAIIVMDNNDLWDTDGSDAMSDYLEAQAIVDSVYNELDH